MRCLCSVAIVIVLTSVALAWADPPLLTVGALSTPVVVDAKAGEDEWRGATPVIGFARPGGQPASATFSCWIATDPVGVVVLWRCRNRPVAQQRGHDGELWRDDSVELMLQPPGAPSYWHFMVSASGDKWEAAGRDGSWNAAWEAAVAVSSDSWLVEMRVPFAALGTTAPAAGTVWRGNLNRSSVGDVREVSSWAPVAQSFHEPERFGYLRFTTGPCPVAVQSVRRAAGHRVIVEPVLTPGAKLSASLLREGQQVSVQTAEQGGAVVLALEQPGSFVLSLQGTDGQGAMVFRQEVPVVRKPPLAVTCAWRLLTGREATLQVDWSGLEEPWERMSVQLAGREVASISPPATGTSTAVPLDLSLLPAGETELLVAAWAGGRCLAELRQTLTVPQRPAWLGSTEGVSDELPQPWTPVAVEGTEVKCWGRSYDFGQSALPERITTAGAQVLHAPLKLLVSAGGRQQQWGPAQIEWTERRDSKAQCNIQAAGAEAALQVTATTEFDGMMRLDLVVTPRPGAKIDAVLLEVPISLAHARYLHACDGSWGRSVVGALPDEGWKHDFMPFVWLGDEDRGLQWFCESDEGWRPADPEAVLTIERSGQAAVLRVNMVGRPLEAGANFRTTFGLQATPVKPIPSDWRNWHITHGAYYGMQNAIVAGDAGVSYPAEGNIRLDRGSVDMWVKPLFDPQIGDRIGDNSVPNHSLFGVELANGDHWGFYWNRDDRDLRYYGRVQGQVQGFLSRPRSNVWREGQWHHVALTWGDALKIYLDGELVASRSWQGTLSGELTGALIRLGSGGPFRDSCGFVVDNLRISDQPLDFADPALRTAEPQPDEHTLLLDTFGEEVGAQPIWLRTAMLRNPGPDWRGVRLSADSSITAGVAGAALQLGLAQRNLLAHLKSLGVNYLVFHEHWTEIQAYGSTKVHDQQLRDLVAACHAAGIKLLLYFGYEFSDAAPEWEYYHDEVLVKPRRGGYTRTDYPQKAYICCFHSPWKEYYLTSIARMIDEYDIDGVYLDGTTEPFGCNNELHGCGYVGEDGQRRLTYPIFAVRDLMRRMMHIIKSRKPEGLISAHMSASVTMPTLAFVDDYWDGEQLDVKERGFRLPLEAFRAEFMGRNWGLPCEFLSYENKPFTFEEALGLALVHDVPVRPSTSGGKLATMSRVWAAWEEFEVDRARWIPYWEGGGPLRANRGEVLISAHVGPRGVLAVVMNSAQQPLEFDLTLDAATAGLDPARLTARDVITGDAVEFTGGVARLKLEPLHMIMLGLANR